MTASKKIAFQGELGANSHEACQTYFPDYEPVPCLTFEEAFMAMQSGSCALGMIPVENSIAGRVGDVHHLLPASGLRIIGEAFKPIRFHLMANLGVTLDTVTTAVSMPIALYQCRNNIKAMGLGTQAAGDTAGAAKALSENPDSTKAAVAPALAAKIYGLDILKSDLEDDITNTTRFLVMTAAKDAEPPPPGVPSVTSFVFRVRNMPAALYKALGGFATNGVNLTKLESYMEGCAFAATMFYAEVDGRPQDPPLARALEELTFFADHVELLGAYPADPFRLKA